MNKYGKNSLVDIFDFDTEKATWVLNEPDEQLSTFLLETNGAGLGALDKPEESRSNPDREMIEAAVQIILLHVGEDPTRQGLQETPRRVAKMYDELLAGYQVDPAELVNGALFDVEYNEMIVVKDIEFFSMCEHHMLPFFGRAHVAYIPAEKIIGLSKIPRIVEMFARRLQVQERMTQQIAEMIVEILQPRGVAVIIEGSHMCSMMRGVKKEHSKMVTKAMIGMFKNDKESRKEFMEHVGKS